MITFLHTVALVLLFVVLGIDDPFVQAALVGLSLAAILLAMVIDARRSRRRLD